MMTMTKRRRRRRGEGVRRRQYLKRRIVPERSTASNHPSGSSSMLGTCKWGTVREKKREKEEKEKREGRTERREKQRTSDRSTTCRTPSKERLQTGQCFPPL